MTVPLDRRTAALAAVLLLAVAACGGAGSGAAAQAGSAGQSAGFVPASAVAGTRANLATSALMQPLPEPLIALGKPALTPAITAPLINDSGAYADGPIVVGTNTVNGYGMEGIVDGTGAGLYGHSASSATNSYGVYGYSLAGDGIYGYSSKSGRGVIGVSVDGEGVEGETSFPSSGLPALQRAGVLGEDDSTDGGAGNAGTAGLSTTGAGVYGQASGSGIGVSGYSASGIGVQASSASASSPALYAHTTSGPAIVTATGSKTTMSLDKSGNMTLAGNLVVDGTITSSAGAGKCGGTCPTPQPAIERTGEGQLISGTGRVQLDPSFASQLDPARTYQVFLTPDGDSKGLYVTDKTANGFTVHENQAGKSTLGFDYRIVATPR